VPERRFQSNQIEQGAEPKPEAFSGVGLILFPRNPLPSFEFGLPGNRQPPSFDLQPSLFGARFRLGSCLFFAVFGAFAALLGMAVHARYYAAEPTWFSKGPKKISPALRNTMVVGPLAL
jgi:hypothetical protein